MTPVIEVNIPRGETITVSSARGLLLSGRYSDVPSIQPNLSTIGKTHAMSEATVTGQVHLIEPTKSFGQKGFRKRTVVLEQANGRFTNYLPFEFIADSCDMVDNLGVGDTIKVTYRLTGRKWQRDEQSEVKFFLSAEATEYELIKAGGGAKSAPASADEPDFGPEDDSAPF